MSDATPPPKDAPPSFDEIGIVASEATEQESASNAEVKALFRQEQTREVIHWIVIWGLRVIGATAVGVVALRVLHLALPEKCQFMTHGQTAHIDSLFLSGGVAVAMARHLNSVMGWNKND